MKKEFFINTTYMPFKVNFVQCIPHLHTSTQLSTLLQEVQETAVLVLVDQIRLCVDECPFLCSPVTCVRTCCFDGCFAL